MGSRQSGESRMDGPGFSTDLKGRRADRSGPVAGQATSQALDNVVAVAEESPGDRQLD